MVRFILTYAVHNHKLECKLTFILFTFIAEANILVNINISIMKNMTYHITTSTIVSDTAILISTTRNDHPAHAT